jgi:Tol biopolymer transport system component
VNIGDTWNESETFRDELTGRSVRRLTTSGRINQTPTYHTNSGFTADGSAIAFVSVREGTTWIVSAEVATGCLQRRYVLNRPLAMAFLG